MGHLGHGTRLCSWLYAGTSQDVPGNPRYTWDTWDMGQGGVASLILGHSTMSQVILGIYTWDIWDMGQGCVAGSMLGHPRMSQVISGTHGTSHNTSGNPWNIHTLRTVCGNPGQPSEYNS